MKKWIAILLACTLLFAFGCKKNEEVPVTTPEPTPAATPQATPEPTPEATATPEPTPSPSEEPEDDTFVYVSSVYGFSVTMPASWEQCCLIEEDNMQVSFYSAANRYVEYDGETFGAGHLFTVMIPEDSMKDGDGYVFPNYEVIGQYGGADILIVYPSDVQIADFDDEDAVAEFGRMSEELPAVIDSITFG